MSAMSQHRRLGFLLVLLMSGCNPFMLPFLFNSEEPKIPAEMYKLYDTERKNQKEVKVAVLTYTSLEVRPEFMNSDKQITQLVSMQLQKLCKDNKEKVTVISPARVEEFKNTHPDWADSHLELEKLGKALKADFVIYIEATEMTLYQPLTGNNLYQGRAELKVSLINVHKPNDMATQQQRELTFSYPSENRGGALLADADTTPQMFRHKFFTAMARQLSGYFTDRPTRDTYLMD